MRPAADLEDLAVGVLFERRFREPAKEDRS
jgi:hypothetical protein